MPYTKEQLKAYYQINKAKLNQQRSERRKSARLGQVKQREVETVSQVETLLETPEQVETRLRPIEVETSQVSQPVKKVETNKQVETSKFWANYYASKKPYCFTCQQKGIKENEYAFCSTEKKPTAIYDEWKRVVHIFHNIYACQVYHWTIYQGQNKRSFID